MAPVDPESRPERGLAPPALDIFPPLPNEPVPDRPADVALPVDRVETAVATTKEDEILDPASNSTPNRNEITDSQTIEKDEKNEKDEKDDGWDAIWDDNHGAYYFFNRFTQETTWINPRVDPNEQDTEDKNNVSTLETPESLEAERLKSMTTFEKYQYLKAKTEEKKKLEEEEELDRLKAAKINIPMTNNQKPNSSSGFNSTIPPSRISKKEAYKIKTQKNEKKEARMREWLSR